MSQMGHYIELADAIYTFDVCVCIYIYTSQSAIFEKLAAACWNNRLLLWMQL